VKEIAMQDQPSRRSALQGFGLAAAGLTALSSTAAEAQGQGQAGGAPHDLAPPGATAMHELIQRLARAPRRRDFRTVPMILDDPMLWDHEAMSELLAYRAGPKQIWDATDIGGSWLGGMHNSLNVQIWSFKHPDFLLVAGTHGPAEMALLDQAMWDKYQLGKLTGGAYASNTLIERHDESDRDHQSETGAYSAAANTVTTLMDRGVVFMACHIALWELSGKLMKAGVNPDHLSHEQMAAELTNHFIPGVVLTPGMVATIPEFQQAGFHYIR
jgi:intracellular sulfur oxidation DsrE/DsrF family protein